MDRVISLSSSALEWLTDAQKKKQEGKNIHWSNSQVEYNENSLISKCSPENERHDLLPVCANYGSMLKPYCSCSKTSKFQTFDFETKIGDTCSLKF